MPVMVTLTITVDDKMQVKVDGPITNKIMCYGLLAMARDIIEEHNRPKVTTAPISDITGQILDNIRRTGRS